MHAEADQIEHTISDEIETQMRANLDDPQLCPHGNPLPGYEYVAADWLPLTGVQPGEKVIIRRIHETAEDNHELMEFLETNGIVPGALAEVMRVLPFNQTLSLQLGEQQGGVGLSDGQVHLRGKGRLMTASNRNETMQLMELQPGKKAVIRRLEGGRTVLSRLAAMGFTPGAAITVMRSSDHGPLLVSLRGSRVALGRGEAAHIFVSFAGKEKPARSRTDHPGTISIALTGQPNVGKSSVFNC